MRTNEDPRVRHIDVPTKKKTTRPRSRLHSLFFLGVGMLATLALIAVMSIVTTWFATTLDDLRYGWPRTFQIDAYVGHNESLACRVIFLPSTSMGASKSSILWGGRWLTGDFLLGDVLVFSTFTIHCTLDNNTSGSDSRIRISCDTSYQLAADPVDERWIGTDPARHNQAFIKDCVD